MRGRILSKAQAEVIAVFVLALLLALMVGVAIRFYVMSSQLLKQVEERKREVQQTVLSGGVRGYITNNTVYLSSGVPLLVYSVMISNGSHILWSNPKPPSGLTSYRMAMPVIEISSIYIPIYSGSLATLVEQCKARVVLVTDKGLIKWCPNIVTKIVNNTITALLTPMTLVGNFKVYYVGNISYFALNGSWKDILPNGGVAGGYAEFPGNSITVLYPLIIFYSDPVTISERWSNTVVNVTLKNTVTGDVVWILFDVTKGSIIKGKMPTTKSNSTYDIVFYTPDKGGRAVVATSVNPASIGGVEVFAFTVYHNDQYYYATELFTSKQASISIDYYIKGAIISGNAPEASNAIRICFGENANPGNVYGLMFNTYTWIPSILYVGVVNRITFASTFASVKPLAITLTAKLIRGVNDISKGAYYFIQYFTTNGGSSVPVSYYIAYQGCDNACGLCDTCVQKPVTGTGTSWNVSKTCCCLYQSGWYTIKAITNIMLPSGVAIPYGVYASVTVTGGSDTAPAPTPSPTPPPPPTPPPQQPPPIIPQWVVEQQPVPTSATPIKTTITVYARYPINPILYRIVITIKNIATNNGSTQTVGPKYLQGYGWGYQITLDDSAPYSVVIKVQHYDGTVKDYVTVFRWSGGNYLGAT